MSLYIGKDNYGQNIIHVSSETSNINTLKSSPYSLTSFHSNLQYLSYTVYTPLTTYYIPDSVANSTGYYVGGIVITMPNDFLSEFSSNSTRFYFILLDDSDSGLRYSFYKSGNRDTMYNSPFCMWYSSPPSAGTNNGLYKGETPYPTSSNIYGYICSSVNTSNIKLIVTNYSDTGVLFNNKLNNSIYINRNSFIIGGVDISNYPYITRHILNTIDTQIDLNGSVYQLCNNNSSGTFSLSTNDHIELKIGGKTIIDSRYNNNLLSNNFRSIVWFNLVVGSTFNITSDILNDKSIIQISYTTAYVIGTGERIFNTKLISYVEGKVIPVIRTDVTSADFICQSGILKIRFNSFWTSSYSNFIGIKHRVFN